MHVNIEKFEPEAFKAVYALERYLSQSKLTPIQQELMKLRASQLNGCAYCLNMHLTEARQHGETEQRLHLMAVWREAGAFSARGASVAGADRGNHAHQRAPRIGLLIAPGR